MCFCFVSLIAWVSSLCYDSRELCVPASVQLNPVDPVFCVCTPRSSPHVVFIIRPLGSTQAAVSSFWHKGPLKKCWITGVIRFVKQQLLLRNVWDLSQRAMVIDEVMYWTKDIFCHHATVLSNLMKCNIIGIWMWFSLNISANIYCNADAWIHRLIYTEI